MRFRPGGGFVFAEELSRYCIAAFDRLIKEGGRMMSIGLHLRTIGRPARIGGLEQILEHVAKAGDTAWVARRKDIAQHWLNRFG